MSHRSKPRAYLLLARVSNLPTVWTNVAAGAVLAGGDGPLKIEAIAAVAVAMSCIYSAGMWMNDACDADADAVRRADRPIPSGDVTRSETWTGALILAVAGGVALAAAHPASRSAWFFFAALAAAIAYYNVFHKTDPLGPAAMGICRGLLYLVAAAAVAGRGTPGVWIGAIALAVYVASLTLVGKTLGPRAGAVMPWLIAGISLVDAAALAAAAPAPLRAFAVIVAVAGFVLARIAHRVVPGT